MASHLLYLVLFSFFVSLVFAVLMRAPEGELVGRHRKLMPTMHERLFHGVGAGDDLQVVGRRRAWHPPRRRSDGAAVALRVLEQREIHYPGKGVAVFRNHAEISGDLETQLPKGIADNLFTIGYDKGKPVKLDTVPCGVIRPIELLPALVNHRFPSGPVTMLVGV